eukprot:gnl/MRDRNA2_/MRDRNA2_99416_c0_seq1.p1 gnl/MRDRNA2_/MRDRNA2_99416_c0~~gnl/MRDRNA2_/MRDRNA2_99416_c0_seq1.p1  ORF type:complete len:213 (+),score=58.82 gnl/MRDRNA2_/MRDRNA2_99416_c0_seq1:121-759(+)
MTSKLDYLKKYLAQPGGDDSGKKEKKEKKEKRDKDADQGGGGWTSVDAPTLVKSVKKDLTSSSGRSRSSLPDEDESPASKKIDEKSEKPAKMSAAMMAMLGGVSQQENEKRHFAEGPSALVPQVVKMPRRGVPPPPPPGLPPGLEDGLTGAAAQRRLCNVSAGHKNWDVSAENNITTMASQLFRTASGNAVHCSSFKLRGWCIKGAMCRFVH